MRYSQWLHPLQNQQPHRHHRVCNPHGYRLFRLLCFQRRQLRYSYLILTKLPLNLHHQFQNFLKLLYRHHRRCHREQYPKIQKRYRHRQSQSRHLYRQ